MKPGDIIEWKGVNKVHIGKVIVNPNCENPSSVDEAYLCQMDNGKTFSLADLRYGKSTRLIEV